jgi:hypothetical protein
MPGCSKCHKDVPKDGFSHSQLKKRSDQRTCKACCSGSSNSASGGNVSDITPPVGSSRNMALVSSSSQHSHRSISTSADAIVAVQIVDSTANHLQNLQRMMLDFKSSFNALQLKYERLQEERDMLKEQVATLEEQLKEKGQHQQTEEQKAEATGSSTEKSVDNPDVESSDAGGAGSEVKENDAIKTKSEVEEKVTTTTTSNVASSEEASKEETEEEWYTVVRRKNRR